MAGTANATKREDIWVFQVMSDSHHDLMAINMGKTNSDKVELRIFDGKNNYAQSTNVVTALSLTERPGQWAFQVMKNGDLMAIHMGPDTDSGMTEVKVLTARSYYQLFGLQTATALELTDSEHGKWAFELLRNDELMAIKMGSSGTEVKILSKNSDYSSFTDQTDTALTATDQDPGQWSFEVMKWANNNLMAIRDEDGVVDMRILKKNSNYGAFQSQYALVTLPLSGGTDYYFAALRNSNLLTVRLQTGKYRLQILKKKSNYGTFTSGTSTPIELM